jgi:ATP-binding protein involved in chromosome partitioning
VSSNGVDREAIASRIAAALQLVRHPVTDRDVMASGIIRGLEVGDGGDVEFGLLLGPDDPAELAGKVRDAAAAVEGVRSVRVNVLGRAETAGPPPPPTPTGRALPIMGSAAPERQAGPQHGGGRPGPRSGGRPGPRSAAADRDAASRHPSEAPRKEGIARVVAVSSGKGGVGKSTVSTNLAAAWARAGHRVGLLDADIYGPDIPTMFGAHGRPRMDDRHVIPIEAHGVRLMSLGFLVDEETPAIWRGPIVMGIVRQFLEQVRWGELDYLVVDLPPGTGDAQLSLCQLVHVDGAVMVTTPQDVAVGGVLKGIRMFQKLDVPVLGIVENMRGFACPDCGSVHDIFGAGGGEKLAAALGVPFLGAVPLGMAVREEGDRGVPTVAGRPNAPEAEALSAIADEVAARLGQLEASTA